jgi:aryl-alcohol dehydrogenase-like predicted oxidoreductase
VTRHVGSLRVSPVGLGCNNLGRRIGDAEARAVVDAALEEGVTFFDTADIYGDGESERLLGRALAGRRDEVVVATKFGMEMRGEPAGEGGRPEWVVQAADASLSRLGTDRIDLYQMHRPDDSVPIAETLGALDDLVRAGKVTEIGCSNFSAEQIDEALSAAEEDGLTPFSSVQNRYSVLHRGPEDDGVAASCARRGLALIPYFPLESGLLTGKYSEGFDGVEGRLTTIPDDRRERFASEPMVAATAKLTAYAESHGRSILELAVSWLLAQPTVASVIAGATRPEQVRANVAAAGWGMTPKELASIDDVVHK